WQRPHARVSVEHLRATQAGLWKRARCFAQEIIYFPRFAAGLVRATFKANLSGSNQVVSIPRNNEKRATVTRGLEIECARRRAAERRHHNVTSFRATNQPRRINLVEQLIHP